MTPWDAPVRSSQDGSLYALVSVLQDALRAAHACEQQIAEAHSNRDDELVSFLESVRDQDLARATQAKRLLVQRLREEPARRIVDPEVMRDFENAAE